MGLDTSHDCWHGPYSAFHRWRRALAFMIGVDLESMDGFRKDWEPDRVLTRWESLKPDPLHMLLHHSDCDGEIAVENLIPIADRLDEILGTIVPEACCPLRFYGARHDGHATAAARADYDGFRKACERFSAGLRRAAAAGEPVLFR